MITLKELLVVFPLVDGDLARCDTTMLRMTHHKIHNLATIKVLEALQFSLLVGCRIGTDQAGGEQFLRRREERGKEQRTHAGVLIKKKVLPGIGMVQGCAPEMIDEQDTSTVLEGGKEGQDFSK